ncbi:unnamed protein product [Musa acuminata subsp. malaccensis]|uniref:(wild Malaysian banana) hypothetical protein n=1 Tax=Musa acuminata subsp. malaccensis TaxID=214687 RepID=A0A8D7EZ05_MUSAM|nr:unnamed protein product [Musa acuminata subsp. malaccensis]
MGSINYSAIRIQTCVCNMHIYVERERKRQDPFLSPCERLLQVEGEEGEDGGPKHGSDSGCNREGGAGGGRGGGFSSEGCSCRSGGDEDGAGDLLHLHCWRWTARESGRSSTAS